jgi:hypothetical protein
LIPNRLNACDNIHYEPALMLVVSSTSTALALATAASASSAMRAENSGFFRISGQRQDRPRARNTPGKTPVFS